MFPPDSALILHPTSLAVPVCCEPCKETLSTYRTQHYIAVRMVGFTLTRSKWINTSMWRTFK